MQLQPSVSSHFTKPLPFTRKIRSAAVRVGGTKYDLLEVAQTATPEEIKSAFRRQVLRWHPDLCLVGQDKGFCVKQFIRVRDAYETLFDPVLRRKYDLSIRPAGAALPGIAVGGGGRRRCFGDWEAQLEELKWRSSKWAGPDSWASRIRSAHQS